MYAQVPAENDMKSFDLAVHGGQDSARFEFAKYTVCCHPRDLFLRYRTQGTMRGKASQH